MRKHLPSLALSPDRAGPDRTGRASASRDARVRNSIWTAGSRRWLPLGLVNKGRRFRAGLTHNVAHPVHPCAGGVAHGRPDRPQVGRRANGELSIGHGQAKGPCVGMCPGIGGPGRYRSRHIRVPRMARRYCCSDSATRSAAAGSSVRTVAVLPLDHEAHRFRRGDVPGPLGGSQPGTARAIRKGIRWKRSGAPALS